MPLALHPTRQHPLTILLPPCQILRRVAERIPTVAHAVAQPRAVAPDVRQRLLVER